MRSAAASFARRRRERLALRLGLLVALLTLAIPASANTNVVVTTVTPVDGATVTGSVTWEVKVSTGNVDHVDFAIDGSVTWTEHLSPWVYNGVPGGLDTTRLSDGAHRLTATAYTKHGKATGSSTVTVRAANGGTAPPPPPPPPPPSPPPPATPPGSTTLPSISGTPTVGETLTASPGTWAGSTPISYSYSWARCNSAGDACVPVSGANSVDYRLVSADVGFAMRVSVAATNSAGSATSTSAPTAVVSAAPSPGTLGSALPPRMPQSSGAHKLIVSPGGSGTACTATAPCSFATAFSKAVSGDLVQLRGNGGSYGRQLVAHKFYSASNPVTVMTYPGDQQAVFAGDTTRNGKALELQDVTAIRIRGITVAPRYHGGIKFINAKHVELDHDLVRDVGRSMTCTGDYESVPPCGWGIGVGVVGAASLSGYTNLKSADVQIWDSTFTNNGGRTWGWQGDVKHAHAIYLCSAGGGNNGGCDGFVIANNLIFDSPAGNAVQMGESATNGFVVNNTIDNTDTRGIYSNGGKCSFASGSAIDPWSSGYTPKTQNIVIRNNIVSNSCGQLIYGAASSNQVGIIVSNNLAFHNGYACDWGCSTGYDCHYGSLLLCTVGTNLPNADPLYVNRTGTWGSTSKDYHLQPGSPALGKSDPAYTPPTDVTGAARAEYGNAATGTVAPALGAFG